MPLVLELHLGTLGTGLDDKARAALQQVDPVSALAFLYRVSERGESVRNPSAFIATAVRNGGGRGPGPAELESALQLLSQDGTLDANAVEALKKASLEAASQALGSLLTQESSAVRNASAYVTRNIANARKQPPAMTTAIASPPVHSIGKGLGMEPMAVGSFLATGKQTAVLGHVGEALLAKWAPTLDEKAMDALMNLPVSAAIAVLHEMDGKAASVRKPSAYVQKACENWKEERQSTSASPQFTLSMAAAASRPHGRAGSPNLAGGVAGCSPAFAARLDADARDALQKVSEEQKASILENLHSRGGSVRNPSAYVVRSVKNLQDEALASGALVDPGGDHSWEATRSFVGAASTGVSEDTRERWWGNTPELDESAQTALSELSLEASQAILLQLDAQGDKVKNPSAYVLRAVGNARKGLGAGGAAVAAGGPAAQLTMHEELTKLGCELDAKAMAALEELGPVAATGILQKLNKQGDTVNNPNAYIMRAVGNEKRIIANPGSSAVKRPRSF